MAPFCTVLRSYKLPTARARRHQPSSATPAGCARGRGHGRACTQGPWNTTGRAQDEARHIPHPCHAGRRRGRCARQFHPRLSKLEAITRGTTRIGTPRHEPVQSRVQPQSAAVPPGEDLDGFRQIAGAPVATTGRTRRGGSKVLGGQDRAPLGFGARVLKEIMFGEQSIAKNPGADQRSFPARRNRQQAPAEYCPTASA